MAEYSGDVVAVLLTTVALASTFMVLRMVARRITHVQYWWDDYLCIGAFLFALGWSAIVLQWTFSAGLGRWLDDIAGNRDDVLEQSRLLLWIAEIVYAFSLALSKLSILGFYWRLFKTSNIRLPIQILTVASIVWLIIRTFMAIFHCVPVQAFWDYNITDKVCNVDDSKFFFGTVLAHLALDLCILALPIVEVKHLQLRLGQKIGVIVLFMFGILVCVVSVVVLVESAKFDPTNIEMPHNIVSIIIWASVEVNFAIISACLPMMRPIFRRVLPGSILASDPSRPTTKGIETFGKGGGIKLSTMTNSKEIDDTSSTHNLADTDVERGSNHSQDYDQPLGGSYQGPQTVISGRTRGTPSTPGRQAKSTFGGIHVKNEMSVSYERA